MAGSIKGIIVEIGGDTSKLQSALKKVNSSTASLSKELKGINSLLKLDPKNTELLSQKQTVLKQNIEQTSEKLKELKNAQEMADETIANGGKISQENYRNLQREIINTQNKLNNLKVEASKWTTAGRSIEEFGNKITNISSKIDKMGTTLTTRLTLPITAIATGLISSAKEFETAFTGVEKTVDGTAEQMEKLKQGIKDMAEEIPASTTEISAVAEAAGQLGIKTEDILSFTRVMIDLGNSTNLSSETAASALAKFANVTKMSSKDYDKLGSTIVALGNNFATTEADIVEMATRLAATGELAGLSQPQILALATAMSSVGIEAEAGGSAMSKLLKKIQVAVETGGSDLKEFSKIAGMTSTEFKKAFEKDAVKALSSFIGGLNDTKRNGKSAISVLEDMGLTEVRLSNTVLSLANASEVMNDAVELGNKSWDENTALTNEASKRYQTLDSRMQMTTNKIKNVATTTGNKLTPTFNKLLDKVDGLIDKFEGLSEEEVVNIVKTGALVAAIGPAIKILGTLGSGIGTTITKVGEFSQAISLMGKTSTEAFNKASDGTKKMTQELTAIASPAGIATIAITATTAALAYAIYKQKEATKETKEFTEEMKNQKEAYEEYNKNIDKTTASNLAEINSVSKLKDELKTLVDENGKVKEGYKSRVDFILNELNKALGKEYKLNDNIVQNYKELQSEIDKTIEKKKAEIILNADEEKYSEAIKQEAEAVKNLKTAREELGMSYEKAKEKCEDYHKAVKDGTISADEAIAKSTEIKNLENKISAYEDAERVVKTCTENKKEYEENYALFVEGKYAEIGKTVKETTSNWSNASIQTIKDTITQEKNNLNIYKEIYKKTGDEIAEEQIAQSEQNLKNLANELVARTSTVNDLGADEVEAWKTLANSSYEEYRNAISKMAPEMQQKIQDTTHVIVSDTGLVYSSSSKAKQLTDMFQRTFKIEEKTKDKLDDTASTINIDTKVKNASKELAKKASAGFNNNINASKWGTDLTDELSKGMLTQKAMKKVTTAASTVAGWVSSFLHFSLPEKGPLSDMDKSMPDMINLMANGINKNKSVLIKSAERMARELDNTLVNDIKVSQIKDFGKLQGGLNRQIVDNAKVVNNDNRKVTFNIQGSNAKEIADEVNRILGSRY